MLFPGSQVESVDQDVFLLIFKILDFSLVPFRRIFLLRCQQMTVALEFMGSISPINLSGTDIEL